jgi:hypothetical protein
MPGGAWTFGGSILTFLFPMILFVLVATALFVSYTKPEVVPGHWVASQRPVSYTAVPRLPEASAAAAAPAAPAAGTVSGADGSADGGTAEGGAAEGGASGTGDGA